MLIGIFIILSSPLDDASNACVVGRGTCFDPAAFLSHLEREAEVDAPRLFFPFPLGAMVECKQSEEKH